MQKARSETEAGGHALAIAHLVPQDLDRRLVLGEHGQKSQCRKVVARTQLVEVRAQKSGQRIGGRSGLQLGRVGLGCVQLNSGLRQHRLALRQLACLLVLVHQGAGLDLRRLHVGLIEGIDAHHRASHGGGNLPGEELAEDLVEVLNLDQDHGMASGQESRDFRVQTRIGSAVQAHVSKDAVAAVDRGRGDGFAIHGRDSLALLAGGLGDQLLQPRAQVGDLRRSEDGDLVAPGIGRRA